MKLEKKQRGKVTPALQTLPAQSSRLCKEQQEPVSKPRKPLEAHTQPSPRAQVSSLQRKAEE